MDQTLIVMAFVVVGLVSGRLLMRRFPIVSRTQIFCAIAAWIGGVLIAGRPGGSQFWHYTGMTIAVITGTFLLFTLLRRWDTSRTTGPV